MKRLDSEVTIPIELITPGDTFVCNITNECPWCRHVPEPGEVLEYDMDRYKLKCNRCKNWYKDKSMWRNNEKI